MANPLAPRLSLVLGGARSGKSALAEKLVLGTGSPPVYIATAEVFDDEMRDRVAAHRTRRGAAWREVEAPRDLCGALADVGAGEAALVDCATLWLSNHLMDGSDIDRQVSQFLNGLVECAGPVTVVSGEVGAGIVPENALARRFRDAQGDLNQKLAERADLVVAVIAGLPLVLKGSLMDRWQ